MSPYYKPYKGESHSKEIDGDIYYFVSSSHHCLPTRRREKYGCDKEKIDPSKCLRMQASDDFYCPAFNNPCPLVGRCNDADKYCTQRKKLICETKLCIYDHVTYKTEPNPIFCDFYAFREKLIEEGILVVKKGENEYSLWSKVCFQNYIQTITTNIMNRQDKIGEKYLNLRRNIEAFKNNCENIKPDVIVVLHYEDIKNKIEEILQNKINGKTFKPILQLSEDNKYYVFAHTESNLYKRYNDSILNDYEEFKPKKKNGNDFSENVRSIVITYHMLEIEKKIDSEKERTRLFSKIKDKYPSLKKKTFDKGFNKLKEYMQDKEMHNQADLLDCYNQLVEYLNNKKVRIINSVTQ